MKKINYGLDAPHIMKRSLFIGSAGLLAGIILYGLFHQNYPVSSLTAFSIAILLSLVYFFHVFIMCFSSFYGKEVMRDKMLDELNLKGNEHILDVGCGRGLLLIGAAKRLTNGGKAYGIDLWRKQDLTDNTENDTVKIATAEMVADRISLVSGDMTDMEFSDNQFDVVISSMAIHNAPTKESRKKAIKEIARVLKPNGRAYLLDFKHTDDYIETFKQLEWNNIGLSNPYYWMFPPVRIVRAVKPENLEAD